jgi:hypothetical protein
MEIYLHLHQHHMHPLLSCPAVSEETALSESEERDRPEDVLNGSGIDNRHTIVLSRLRN